MISASPSSSSSVLVSTEPVLAGSSASAIKLRTQVERLGRYIRVALLTGDAGSGKSAIARALHVAGGSFGPFVLCRPEDLLASKPVEAQGVISDLLASAEGGTLVFPEIGRLQPLLQAALLGALPRAREAGIRLLATTSEDLRFRAGFERKLLENLAAFEIAVPSLHDRAEDLPAIATALARAAGERHGRTVECLAPDFLAWLGAQPWRGNLEHLQQVIEHSVHSGEGPTVERAAIAVQSETRSEPTTLPTETPASVKLQDIVDAHVRAVLRQCDGNKLRAAELLGISRSTLYRMLESGRA